MPMHVTHRKRPRLSTVLLLLLIVIGFVAMGAAFTPYMNPPQCENALTVENSNCIIGANMGAGMLFLLGFAISVLASLSLLLVHVVRYVIHRLSSQNYQAS